MKKTLRFGTYCCRLLLILPGIFLLQVSPVKGQNIDFGKSYINITKGLNGGTIETGDTLEIRASIVVRSGRYDSCGYIDAIPAGTVYIPGTIRVLTNEGKIYKQFTDAAGDDEGWISGSNVTIHLGYRPGDGEASAFRRGRIRNTHYPSFFGGTCIMVASFQVVVTAAIGTNISTGGGSMTYRLTPGGSLSSFTFPSNTVAIYTNYGVCSNAVGVNAIGTEFNGTFGSGPTRNRGTSANVPPGYTYALFTNSGPNDYYYGVANNTSTINNYTTSNSWLKPDGSFPTHRVFSVWDIIGDHTGAADPYAGNSATDTVANNNGGYMLIVNAAYRIDSAFQQTISGLCPNTYYEISCWIRNICSKCGCDSTGKGASSASYIPTAPGDSSGVSPNITFEVNGVDYYTTGNILYTGKWVKKGFTYLTGPAQTSITLKFFNNAPGGGGNDWSLDDITVASCSPELQLNPSPNPFICENNLVEIGATVYSYFNNYTYYKWQESTDNGGSWFDTGVNGGPEVPVWNGSEWEYSVSYPSFIGTSLDSGKKYRLVIATTASNLADANCSFTDATVITLTVDSCLILPTDFIGFTGHAGNTAIDLTWTTNQEFAPLQYIVEKSTDGVHFLPIATVNSYHNNQPTNQYYYTDNSPIANTVYYRIKLSDHGNYKYSKTLQFLEKSQGLSFGSTANPFKGALQFEINSAQNTTAGIWVIDQLGRTMSQYTVTLNSGRNPLVIPASEKYSAGIYTLKVVVNDFSITRKMVKASY